MITKITISFLVILELFSTKYTKIVKIFDEIEMSQHRIIPHSGYFERIFENFDLTVKYSESYTCCGTVVNALTHFCENSKIQKRPKNLITIITK